MRAHDSERKAAGPPGAELSHALQTPALPRESPELWLEGGATHTLTALPKAPTARS